MSKALAAFLGALVAAIITALVTTATQELAPRLQVVAVGLLQGQPLTINHEYTALISNDTGASEAPIEAKFTLTFNAAEVVGTGGEDVPKWRLRGFLNHGRMVLGYRSIADQGQGYGTYFLNHTSNEPDVFVGRVEGASCSSADPCSEPRVVRCNVILVRAPADSETVAEFRRRYSAFLAPTGCGPDPIIGPNSIEPVQPASPEAEEQAP